jgi:hypothetical protein
MILNARRRAAYPRIKGCARQEFAVPEESRRQPEICVALVRQGCNSGITLTKAAVLKCAKGCHLGLLGGFSKADIYGAGHWARVPLTILQTTGWILMGGVIV